MENPIITMGRNSVLTVSQHTHRLELHMETNAQSLCNWVCSFLDNNVDLYAAVMAPSQDAPQLARRIVSFLSAYMRIADATLLETEILRCIQRKSLSPSNNANNTL